MSTNTGIAPQWTITFTVDTNVIGETMTSSPVLIPCANNQRCNAAVQEETARAYFDPQKSEKLFSNRLLIIPVVSQPLVRQLVTAATSSCPISGPANLIIGCLLILTWCVIHY